MSKLLSVALVLFCCFLPLGASAEDGQNDIKNPIEGPSSIHIHNCLGTDIDKKEVLLLDRLCINRAGVGKIIEITAGYQADNQKLVDELNKANLATYELEKTKNQQVIIAGVAGAGGAAVVITAVLLGLKAAGKL